MWKLLAQLPDQIYVNQPETILSNVEALVRVPSGNEYSAGIKGVYDWARSKHWNVHAANASITDA